MEALDASDPRPEGYFWGMSERPVEGGTYLDWAHGTVQEVVVTKRTKKFKIKWDKECLLPLDKETTVEKIFVSKWNPKKPVAGAWREF